VPGLAGTRPGIFLTRRNKMMRESVQIFAKCMESVLAEHDDECGWEDSHLDFLRDRLNANVKELNGTFEIPLIDIDNFIHLIGSQRKTLIDIANYCMMLHENMGKKLYIEGE